MKLKRLKWATQNSQIDLRMVDSHTTCIVDVALSENISGKDMTTTRSELEHKQAPIKFEGEIIFSVDKKLQKLIQFFFDNGIVTFNSCEDNVEGTCWIEYDLDDWIAMSEISFRSESQDLYRFIEEECDVKLHSSDDGHPDESDEEWIEGDDLIWTASVRFPKERLRAFEKLIRATFAEIHSA